MNNNLINNLKKLAEIPSVSGNEAEIREYILGMIKGKSFKYFIDLKGNLIIRKGKYPKKLALLAHMDKEGFMVSGVGKSYLKVVGIRKYNLFPENKTAQVMAINSKGDKLYGELFNQEKSKNNLRVKKVNTRYFEIGDYVAFYTPFEQKGDKVHSSHLDNSVGVAVAIEVLNSIKNGTVIFSAQEAIGFHGIAPAIYKVKPEHVVLLDATYASDKGVSGASLYVGKGPTICLKDKVLGDRKMINDLMNIAKNNNIPYQLEIWEEATSDLMVIHNMFEGIPVVFVGIPVKNHMTPRETGSLQDIEYMNKLLIHYFNFAYEA